MIALASDCLLFKTPNGESVPYSADMVSIEFSGDAAQLFDAEFVQHASKAVFHYFKHDLGRLTVSVGEFAGALESVLRGFGVNAVSPENDSTKRGVIESDLQRLASESGKGCELFFFPRLRD